MKRIENNRIENTPETIGDIMDYLESLKQDGSLSKIVLNSMRLAVKRVYSTLYPDLWEELPIQDINIDNDMEKFKEAISGHYSRVSITQSKSRINRAIKWFTNHIEDPSWQPPETARRIKTRKTASENSEDDREMYDFLVPLNDSKTVARLHMPCSLSKNDADRCNTLIDCLTY